MKSVHDLREERSRVVLRMGREVLGAAWGPLEISK